jgi:hypothetical protein|tara:strand:+ start:138 stop:458 length:321 start_codon:yes stop_codon:yes gene_type:complete
MKKLSINNLELSFREIKLYRFKNNLENIFKDYKSKIIAETINRNKYKNLKSLIENENETVELALAHTIKNKAEAAYRRGDQLERRRGLMLEWDEFIERKVSETNFS